MEIDKSLYSRQLYTIGKDAMNELKNTSVIVSGMTGLGVEVAKCVILTGVKSVTLHDTKSVALKDLATNYYAKKTDIGKLRVNVVRDFLAGLNPYVNVTVNSEELNEELIKENQILVICDKLAINQIHNNYMARRHKTKFILGSTLGLMGSVFCDFGDEFTVIDPDGETPVNGIILSITNGEIMCAEPHGLYVGDTVFIKTDKFEISTTVEKIIDTKKFKIADNCPPDTIFTNASFTQIKQKNILKFEPLEKSILDVEFATVLSEDFDRQRLLHDFAFSLSMFIRAERRLPKPWDVEDANKILKMVECKTNEQKKVVKKLSYTVNGKLCPIDAVLGSIIAQEVMKASSKKYTPIKQWLYMDFTNILPDTILPQTEVPKFDTNNRYYAQELIFGKSLQKKIEESSVFVVGAGAIGCEHMKNLAQLGTKNIIITDMDRIEKSNLNRQFLFDYSDIGKFKSEIAKNAILKMNPDINVVAQQNKVCADTIKVYNTDFFSDITCVLTALDNIQARLFVDSLCLANTKPFVDSGTLGTKGNVQAIIPHMTESYGSSADQQEKEVPMCTIKNFPYEIEHCIQWARNMFDGVFVKAPQNFMRYKTNPELVNKMAPLEQSEIMSDVVFVMENIPCHKNDCIQFALKLWYENFRDKIYHLTEKYPKDCTTDGVLFWTGTKKFPTIIELSDTNSMCVDFIESTANLWADVFGFEHVTVKQVKSFIKKAKKPSIKLPTEEMNSKPILEELECTKCNALEFEKDDDTNFHIDFVTSASNLRALNYGIETADKFKTKGIAGKIIPAIITTTSLVSGLACIEYLKIVQGMNKLELYNNSFVNLALPIVAFSEPIGVTKRKIGNYEYSIWDSLEFNDMKIKDLIKEIKNKIEDDSLDILSISTGQLMIYSVLSSLAIQEKRLNMTVREICTDYNSLGSITVSISFDTDDDSIDNIICKIKM